VRAPRGAPRPGANAATRHAGAAREGDQADIAAERALGHDIAAERALGHEAP
jgi:hypothetical protein